MDISCVKAVFYSPTGNTGKTAVKIAEKAAENLGVDTLTVDFTLPGCRKEKNIFRSSDLVIFGTPVYAGRVPNKILPYIQSSFSGGGALAVPLVTFGNRNFDDALVELRNELEKNDFHTIAGAAFAAAHVFSDIIAAGRPDEKDISAAQKFAEDIAEKVRKMRSMPAPIAVRGNQPLGPYYTPLGTDGKPAVFLKAKPKTDPDRCSGCGICAEVCPMGSVNRSVPSEINGICIKCQACVKKCPEKAKYFDDPAFLSHIAMLEKNYLRRAVPEIFI